MVLALVFQHIAGLSGDWTLPFLPPIGLAVFTQSEKQYIVYSL
jgi:hypothetical protein